MANLASDVVKMGSFNGKRKPSAQDKRAGSKVNVVDIVSEEKRLDLSERETWAVKRFFSIEKTQSKQLIELRDIGQVILDIRGLYTEDTVFSEEVKKREIGKIPYGTRYILMSLAELWSELKPKLGTEGYTSKSPETLVKTLRAEKRENGETTAKRPSKKSKTSKKNQKTDPKMTKAQLLTMIQAGLDNGVITTADLKKMKKTVTK